MVTESTIGQFPFLTLVTETVGLAAFHKKLTTTDLLHVNMLLNRVGFGILAQVLLSAVTVFSGNEGQPLALVKALLIDLLQEIYSH